MTNPHLCSTANHQTRGRLLSLAVPALALALSLLPGLSPVVRAQDDYPVDPPNEVACDSTVQQSSAAASGFMAPQPNGTIGSPWVSEARFQGDYSSQCDPQLQFGNTADFNNAPAEVRPDSDGDGLYDDDEWNVYGTDAYWWDTDGDGSGDGEEVYYGTDPLGG